MLGEACRLQIDQRAKIPQWSWRRVMAEKKLDRSARNQKSVWQRSSGVPGEPRTQGAMAGVVTAMV
jgi:hypothetical protein